jgi:hypothetical protein
MGIWSLISIGWGIVAPLIIEKLHPLVEGTKKMLLVLVYCFLSAIIVIGVKTAFMVNEGVLINWQSAADIMVIWVMLTAETKATWSLFWSNGFNN